MPRRPPASRMRSERSTSSWYMKNSSLKPPTRSQSARVTARQAPERNAASRGSGGIPAASSPASPAHAMPVKWITPPVVLSTRPPCAVTSPIHAAHFPRGARIASTNPGRRCRVGIEEHDQVAARCPGARVRAGREAEIAFGFAGSLPAALSSRTVAGVSSLDALSTTTSSSPAASCSQRAGSEAATASRLLYVTTTTDSCVAVLRTHAGGHASLGPPTIWSSGSTIACPKRTDRHFGSG